MNRLMTILMVFVIAVLAAPSWVVAEDVDDLVDGTYIYAEAFPRHAYSEPGGNQVVGWNFLFWHPDAGDYVAHPDKTRVVWQVYYTDGSVSDPIYSPWQRGPGQGHWETFCASIPVPQHCDVDEISWETEGVFSLYDCPQWEAGGYITVIQPITHTATIPLILS